MLTSLPVVQPQPNQEFYSLDVLTLLQTYTRDSYRAAGNGDPVWDSSRTEQDWWDDTYDGKTGPVTFNAIQYAGDGTATIVQITQDATAMATPNFKGLPNYPVWTPAPTTAVQPHALGTPSTPVDPGILSTQDQAQALMTELGGTSVVDTGANEVDLPNVGEVVFPITYGTETRRAYAVVLANAKQFNVGQALGEKYAKGIGWPGQWVEDAIEASGLTWQAGTVPDGSASTAAAMPVPCRVLLPNEQLQNVTVGFFKATQIQRTDLTGSTVPVSDPDATILADIQTKVTAMYNLLIPHS